jgi:HlyD family secretion protein
MSWLPSSRRGRVFAALAAGCVVIAGTIAATRWHPAAPSLPTGEVTRGEFVETVEIRGEVKPRKSVIISAPMQAGDLQILKISPNGSAVKAGDVVLQFDRKSIERTIKEQESALRQANEELAQAKSQSVITIGQDSTDLLHSQFDLDRAKLGVTEEGIVSKVDAEKNRLAVADAQQKVQESETKSGANKGATTTAFATQESKIAKVRADLERSQRSLAALEVKAPADGVVSILPNYRASSPMSAAPEFRAGDKAWAGAQVLQLPDLTSVHLEARLDESDRGRLQVGQRAGVRVDAIADHEYAAEVTDLSVLARIDFSSGWPPQKNFDLRLTFRDADQRLRPGMSAMARIEVGRLPDVLLVPAKAVFLIDGRAVVYRLERSTFVPVTVDVIKRSKDQAAVKGPLKPGDRLALTKPDAGTGP